MQTELVINACGRKRLTKVLPDDADNDDVLTVSRVFATFHNHLLEHAMRFVRSFLCKLEVSPDVLQQLQICWSYTEALSRRVCNAAAIFNAEYDIDTLCHKLKNGQCACANLPSTFKSDAAQFEGTVHVCSRDTAIVPNSRLAAEINKGLNHIPVAPLCTIKACDELISLTLSAAEKCAVTLTDAEVETLRVKAYLWVHDELESLWSRSDPPFHPIIALWGDPDVISALNTLHSSFFIAEHDKASGQAIFVCKEYAQYVCLQRLCSDSFVRSDLSTEQVLHSVQQQLDAVLPNFGNIMGRYTMPYLRISYKAHKSHPDNFRFITNAADCMLTPATKIAQAVAQRTLSVLQVYCGIQNDQVRQMHGTGTQHYPIITDFTECILNSPEVINSDRTADISKCFEAIPLSASDSDGLLHVLQVSLEMAVSFMRRQTARQNVFIFIKYLPSKQACLVEFSYRKPAGGNWQKFSTQQVMQLYSLVVQNAYVQQGTHIFRQTVGIPMGFSCSPDMVNLYILTFEIQAVQRILKFDRGEIRAQKLSSFKHMFRLMDDLRLINGDAIHTLIFEPSLQGDVRATTWIYPSCLQIKETTGEDGKVVFLDILTRHHSNGSHTTQTYRKEVKLPFVPVKYCMLQSNRPASACYNVLIGLVRSALYHCSGPAKAAQDIHTLIRAFERNGYNKKRLRNMVLGLLTERSYPGVSYEVRAVSRLWMVAKTLR